MMLSEDSTKHSRSNSRSLSDRDLLPISRIAANPNGHSDADLEKVLSPNGSEKPSNKQMTGISINQSDSLQTECVRVTDMGESNIENSTILAGGDQDKLSKDDQMRSGIITKNVLLNWLNIYAFIGIESMRLLWEFDYKFTVGILLFFDISTLAAGFRKYRINKRIDEDEFLTEDETDLRKEYSKFLMLRVSELVIGMIYKILCLVRLETPSLGWLSLTYLSAGLLAFAIFQIAVLCRITVKEYNPFFNEKLVWIFKIFLVIQAFLISLKIEDQVAWKWLHIFWPSFVYLSLQVLISIGFVVMIIQKSWIRCRHSKSGQSQAAKEQTRSLIGITWLFLLQAAVSVSAGIFIFAFIAKRDEQLAETSLLHAWMGISGGFLAITAAFTVGYLHQINWFVYDIAVKTRDDTQDEEEEEIEYIMNDNIQEKRRQKIKQKRMKTIDPTEQDEDNKNVPLFLLSSTYFSAFANKGAPGSNGLMINLTGRKKQPEKNGNNNINGDGEDKQDGNRNGLKQDKLKERKTTQGKNSNPFERLSHSFMGHNEQGIGGQKQYKNRVYNDGQMSDNRDNNSRNQNNGMEDKNGNHGDGGGNGGDDTNQWKRLAADTNNKFMRMLDTPQMKQLAQQISTHKVQKHLFMTPHVSPRRSNYEHSNEASFTSKNTRRRVESSVFQENELAVVNLPNMQDQTNTACVICFDNTPDSVYMPCGHGGVCYECSVDILKNTGECYLCREPIKEILRLNVAEKDKDHGYRVVALTTLIDESVYEDEKPGDKGNLNHIQEEKEEDEQGVAQ